MRYGQGVFDAGDAAELLDDERVIFRSVVGVKRLEHSECAHNVHQSNRNFEGGIESRTSQYRVTCRFADERDDSIKSGVDASGESACSVTMPASERSRTEADACGSGLCRVEGYT